MVAGSSVEVQREPISFPSSDGESTISGCVWTPAPAAGAAPAADATSPAFAAATPAPRGIVQLVHGMAEHVGRYDDLACHLVECGFVVCGDDHIGHGLSVSDPSKLGCLPPKGKDFLIEDEHQLRSLVSARFPPQTPYIMYGHSMGSFITRAYLARHGQGLAGAILCGTAQQPLALSRIGHALARILGFFRGDEYRSSFLDDMGAGAYSKQIENARTPFDWLCTDPAVVDAYLADDLCGFMFSVGGYAALTDLTGEIATKACASKVPKDLPLFFIAGDQDPVGDCGAGVRAAADQHAAAGVLDVQVKLYPGMRHEIHNEPGHAQVYEDVVEWMEAHACKNVM